MPGEKNSPSLDNDGFDDAMSAFSNLDLRLQKVEGLLFHDTEERPSLQTIMIRIDKHVSVTCTYARWIFRGLLAFGSTATAIGAIYAAGTLFGVW